MLLENTPAFLSLGKLCEEFGYSCHWTSGQKPHLIKNGKKIHCDTSNHVPFVVLGLSMSSFSSSTSAAPSSQGTVTDMEIPATRRSESTSEDSSARGKSRHESAEIENPNKNDDEELQSDELQGVPDWLQEFKHGLVDESVPVHRDAPASSSRELLSEREQKWCRVNTTFLLIFRKTGIAIFVWGRNLRGLLADDAPVQSCPERKIGDGITADRKVLSEGCESPHTHRYAVVVQDLATQWIQAYPCKTKTSQETQKSLQKFLEPTRKPKVIYTDNSLEFGKACEELTWNHCTSTPHRSETKGIAVRAVHRIEEGTSAVLLLSGLDEKWWADSMVCHCYLRNIQDLLSGGKTPYERRFGTPFNGRVILFGAMLEYHLQKTYRIYISLVQKSCQVHSSDMYCVRERI